MRKNNYNQNEPMDCKRQAVVVPISAAYKTQSFLKRQGKRPWSSSFEDDMAVEKTNPHEGPKALGPNILMCQSDRDDICDPSDLFDDSDARHAERMVEDLRMIIDLTRPADMAEPYENVGPVLSRVLELAHRMQEDQNHIEARMSDLALPLVCKPMMSPDQKQRKLTREEAREKRIKARLKLDEIQFKAQNFAARTPGTYSSASSAKNSEDF